MKCRALVIEQFLIIGMYISILILSFRILWVVLTVTISIFLTVKVIVKCVVPENIHTQPTEKLKIVFALLSRQAFEYSQTSSCDHLP